MPRPRPLPLGPISLAAVLVRCPHRRLVRSRSGLWTLFSKLPRHQDEAEPVLAASCEGLLSAGWLRVYDTYESGATLYELAPEATASGAAPDRPPIEPVRRRRTLTT